MKINKNVMVWLFSKMEQYYKRRSTFDAIFSAYIFFSSIRLQIIISVKHPKPVHNKQHGKKPPVGGENGMKS